MSAAPRRSPWARDPRTWLVVGAIASGALLLALVTAVPAPVTFSGYATTPFDCAAACPAVVFGLESIPSGPHVTVEWADETGGSVRFVVWFTVVNGGNSTTPVCAENGTGGACAFVSLGGLFTFVAQNVAGEYGQTVNYTGVY